MSKKDSDAMADALELGSEGGKTGHAGDYSFTESDADGFNIETTSDPSESMARRAVQQAKGDGDNDGVSGGSSNY